MVRRFRGAWHGRVVVEFGNRLGHNGQVRTGKDVINSGRAPVWIAGGLRRASVGVCEAAVLEKLNHRAVWAHVQIAADDDSC